MESWDGRNYLTANESLRFRFINSSTQDWNIGFLPSNLIILGASSNQTDDFPGEFLVVGNAWKTHLGSSEIEVAVYGIAAGISIVLAAVWVFFNWATIWKPGVEWTAIATSNPQDPEIGSGGSSGATDPSNGGAAASSPEQGLSVAVFRSLLDKRYYEPVTTEVELYQRDEHGYDDTDEKLAPSEVESLTALMREVYRLDLLLWSSQSARNRTRQDHERLRDRSDAAWAEVRDTVGRWSHRVGGQLGPGERRFLGESAEIVQRIPAKRYGERGGLTTVTESWEGK